MRNLGTIIRTDVRFSARFTPATPKARSVIRSKVGQRMHHDRTVNAVTVPLPDADTVTAALIGAGFTVINQGALPRGAA